MLANILGVTRDTLICRAGDETMALGRLLTAGALAALGTAAMPGIASAVPIASGDYFVDVYDGSTGYFDRQAGSTLNGTLSDGTSSTGGSGNANAYLSGVVPSLEAKAEATGSVTVGAGASLLYYMEWVGPSGSAGSLPIDMSLTFNSRVQGDNASSGTSFQLATYGLSPLDSVNFITGGGCFTNSPPLPAVTCTTPSFSGTVLLDLTPNQLYQISMSVKAGAGGSNVLDAADAFIDPHFFVDMSFGGTPSDYTLVLSDGIGNGSSSSVPEPVSLALFGVGLASITMIRRRKA